MKSVAIAGATGFIGRWFIDRFHKDYHIIALSRTTIEENRYPSVEWRKTDLYSLSSTNEALAGADYALYLVHSMQPSTRLNQSSFDDTDLLLADNFARSAKACGIKQIVFVGGILPKEEAKFSRHLRSRLETEETLGSRGVPVTTVRAGIIVGPGGSSFSIMKQLVLSLPIMACPKWCQSKSQPIDIDDILLFIRRILECEKSYGAVEVGGKDEITYMELLRKTAFKLGKRRIIFSVPFFTLGLSKLWVAVFSKSSTNFVSPLIESLRHDMRVDQNQAVTFEPLVGIDDSLKKAIEGTSPLFKRSKDPEVEKNTVRSVQRLVNNQDKSAQWIADEYPKWLSRFFRLIIKASSKDRITKFSSVGMTLLELTYMPERSDEKRRLFFITGGLLAKRKDMGWLEFRSVLENKFIITAIHRFVPSLPWFIYRNTQAVIHLFVMNQFNNFLMKGSEDES